VRWVVEVVVEEVAGNWIGLGMLRAPTRQSRCTSDSALPARTMQRFSEGAKCLGNSSGLTRRCQCGCLWCANGWCSSGERAASFAAPASPIRALDFYGKMIPRQLEISLHATYLVTLYVQSNAPQGGVPFGNFLQTTIWAVAMLWVAPASCAFAT
jgi:hypothetical protein